MGDALSVETIRRYRALLIEYMLMKAALEDWHGVNDAANDLREFDAKYGPQIGLYRG